MRRVGARIIHPKRCALNIHLETNVAVDRRRFSKTLLAGIAAGAISPTKAKADTGQTAAVSCTVLLDAETDTIIRREGPCDRMFSPCSSFKLAIAAMGFDAGLLTDPHNPRFEYIPEYGAQADRDKKPVDPAIWLADSVVWYSQQITKKLGMERFRHYVDQFDYGNRDLTGNPGKHDGLTQAWLMSSLQISPDQQVHFIKRLVDGQLGISDHAFTMLEATMPVYAGTGDWIIRGKSGSGWLQSASGAHDMNKPQGWFVGWANKGTRRVIFAHLRVGSAATDVPGGTTARQDVREQLESWVN